ncbi:MAG: glycosyltransferase family 2 protein [Armatimonadota bacterium]|nr:glycosyltransferase family 2 protein [Armatimonadota bacterium]
MSIKLSVCITAYNRTALLDRTLQCLADQTRQPDEVIVSDDCSPDDPIQMIEKWRGRFPRFVYNRNERNLHMPGNLNVAVGLATGEYIANLHDADELDPTLLEKWEYALDAYPGAGFVFCDMSHCTLLHLSPDPLTPGRIFYEKYLRPYYGCLVWGTVMARRAAYEKLLPFDPAYSIISDVDMWMRMCLHYDVAYVAERLMTPDYSPQTYHQPRLSGQFRWHKVESAWKLRRANIYRFYGDQPGRLRRELARHHLAVQRHYLRILFGRVWHREWALFREGLASCRHVGWPLRILGGFSHGQAQGQ